MAKVVKFNAKDSLGKEFTVVDTFNNVKIVNKDMKDMLDKIDAYEQGQMKAKKQVTLMDYEDIISECVMKGVAHLLTLDKSEKEKLQNMSYSDVFEFYSNVANKFLAMQIPDPSNVKDTLSGVNDSQEKEDPKQKDANQLGISRT